MRSFTGLLVLMLLVQSSIAELDALPRGLQTTPVKGKKIDLDEIKARGFIRVLTRNNPQCYFMHRDQLLGFEYELIQRFAKQHGLEVIVIVPEYWFEMEPWLQAGRADLIASAYTITPSRAENRYGNRFCHPYGNIHEVIVARREDDSVKSQDDLAGRTLHVRPGSSYHESLRELRRETGMDFKIVATPKNEETYTTLEKVARGEYDLTCADLNILDQSIFLGEALKPVLKLGGEHSYGWMVRNDQPLLYDAVNSFFEQELGTPSYNRLYTRYFSPDLNHPEREEINLSKPGPISPYDDLIKKYAAEYEFPWSLICAQMFQESSFRKDAESWSGAQGLMQLMPATAKEMRVSDPLDPAQNIRGGVHYLRNQYDRLPEGIDPVNRTCFALAAYNGGFGHLIDARNLAGQLGRDPNVWADNVDYAYTLLSSPEYAKSARYGYCRSEEITGYVRKIMARYIAYDTAHRNEEEE